MANTILKEADLFCPNSVRINFTIYHFTEKFISAKRNDLTAAEYRFGKAN
ncbi:ABC transporter ATP-binding protein [Fructilactobacillus sanfranciscensis]|nr:ABC transporter ATP-binding protein [Fructilactobacillus sanfranciscensis]